MDKKNEKTDDKKKKKPVVPVCEENSYIQNKRIKEGTGLSPKAQIIME